MSLEAFFHLVREKFLLVKSRPSHPRGDEADRSSREHPQRVGHVELEPGPERRDCNRHLEESEHATYASYCIHTRCLHRMFSLLHAM